MTVWRQKRGRGAAYRAVGCAGLLAAVSASLCGCSGTGAAAEDGAAGRDAVAIVRRSADVLAESGSSHAMTAVQMASGGTRLTIHGEGGFDYARDIGELRVTLPVERGGGDRGPVTEVFAPGRLFMKNRGAGVPRDKWIEIDVTTLSDGNLVTAGATDPISAAELLRGARRAVDLGETEVDGEAVRHYRGVTDIAAAARAAVGPAREQLAAAVTGFAGTRVPFDAFIDDSGLLRKVRHTFRFLGVQQAEPGPPEAVDVTTTVVLYDFGSLVDVRLPERGEIYSGAVVVTQG